jgi:rare lipoprotein A
VRAILAAALLLLAAAPGPAEEGLASWYGGKFQGRRTASGEIFDTQRLTAAHRSLPFGTRVLVTNLTNGRSVEVRINDRGPFVAGRVIDLSLAAARAIGLAGRGVAAVRLEVLAVGEPGAPTRQGSSLYRLQLGSFRQPANAEGLRARLAAAGFAAELEPAEGGVTRVVFRRLNPFELASLRKRLAAAGWTQALVRREP